MRTHPRNYKVPGTKMTGSLVNSESHRTARNFARHFWEPLPPGVPSYSKLSPRRVKLCKHRRWVDTGYGGPESGGDGGYCRDCGYSFWHQYY